MKTLRIRKSMVLGMLAILVIPWWTFFVVHTIHTGHLQPWYPSQSQQQQVDLNQALQRITTHSADWSRAEFQRELQQQLSKSGIKAVILSPENQVIFSSQHTRHQPHWMPTMQATVVKDSSVRGTVQLYAPGNFDTTAAFTALAALVLTIFLVGYMMRRHVVKPLEAMSTAARSIGEGDMELHLPASRVAEIAQVKSGFEVMVAGLQESFAKQAKLEEERRFFIGAIAHDLRTPLFALRGYLDGLEQGVAKTPEKVEQYIAVAKDKANQLDRLVSDLFAFTKLEYMEQVLQRDPVDLADLLTRSLNGLRPAAETKGVKLHMESPAVGCLVVGDAHLLARAIGNLFDNALRYTPAGGKITCSWHQDAGLATLVIRDTGPGFAEEDLQRVFDPLFRGETSRNRATGGAGLGLAISRRIFRAHGGDIKAENHPEGGAVVTAWVADH